jgi:hypothetical protein
MVGPVWSKSAKPGDTVRAVSAFPVTIGNAMAIPPGTFVEGIIDSLTHPTWRTKRADFQMHFTKLIFVNGYTVDLPDAPQGAATARLANSLAGPTATASVRVDVSYASDILLDNGSQFEMVVQRPISLDARQVAVAARRTKPPQVAPYQSATRCRSTPGSPGTSDTVIPGTPPKVIPGGPGMPDIVIPGSPPVPGTPTTVIPGSPGTPGTVCPGPPIVVSDSRASVSANNHAGNFELFEPVVVGGKTLPALELTKLRGSERAPKHRQTSARKGSRL